MVDVAEVDTNTTMMGQKTSLPIFICPTGMSKLASPEGEPGLAAAAGECDIIQMASCPPLPSLISDLDQLVRTPRGDRRRSRARSNPVHAAVRRQAAQEL